MKALVGFFGLVLCAAAQRDTVAVQMSIDSLTRAALNKTRAAIPSSTYSSRSLLVSVAVDATTLEVTTDPLPGTPFQAALKSENSLEIVRVTAISTANGRSALTVVRGRGDTTAMAFDAGAKFIPLQYDTIEQMLKLHVLVPFVAGQRAAVVRAEREAATAAAIAAARESAAQ